MPTTLDNTGIQWAPGSNSTFSYDAFGKLLTAVTPAGASIAYTMDGKGNVVRIANGGVTTTRYIYDDESRIAGEFTDAGVMWRQFVYGTDQHSPDYLIDSTGPVRFIKDHLGSPRLIVKASNGVVLQRMDYDEFGRVTANTSPTYQPFGFAGGFYLRLPGLVKFGARYYDPETGRWTSKDPILFNGGAANLYGYVQNDPVNFIDPKGLWSFQGSFFAGAGGAITVGADNSSGRPFLTLRFGYGFGIGASVDENGSSPVPRCPKNGLNVSIGVYGEASVNNGPHEFGISGAGGVSSKKDTPYYLNSSPTNTIGTSTGAGAGASVGVELSFF